MLGLLFSVYTDFKIHMKIHPNLLYLHQVMLELDDISNIHLCINIALIVCFKPDFYLATCVYLVGVYENKHVIQFISAKQEKYRFKSFIITPRRQWGQKKTFAEISCASQI